ncbi:hypothetical protein A2160_01860 [Candidatus Beckwithbacteria bacterium RBG_13_42_9]|uniref:Uncharacterized protein n=1 Tax=Candidatus Beckwithbacteria bacterium RBG_13_42_9 TaxID=1797457 RepID=A0A1F5E8M0_9BACT|nr:MAG: hypothetical protein A2160_01860 [Candidatus Beckwithbacteria bacterium RBG_13_42_9]
MTPVNIFTAYRNSPKEGEPPSMLREVQQISLVGGEVQAASLTPDKVSALEGNIDVWGSASITYQKVDLVIRESSDMGVVTLSGLPTDELAQNPAAIQTIQAEVEQRIPGAATQNVNVVIVFPEPHNPYQNVTYHVV